VFEFLINGKAQRSLRVEFKLELDGRCVQFVLLQRDFYKRDEKDLGLSSSGMMSRKGDVNAAEKVGSIPPFRHFGWRL